MKIQQINKGYPILAKNSIDKQTENILIKQKYNFFFSILIIAFIITWIILIIINTPDKINLDDYLNIESNQIEYILLCKDKNTYLNMTTEEKEKTLYALSKYEINNFLYSLKHLKPDETSYRIIHNPYYLIIKQKGKDKEDFLNVFFYEEKEGIITILNFQSGHYISSNNSLYKYLEFQGKTLKKTQ